MLRRGMTRLTESHERAHDTNCAANASDVFVADVNPLIRQLLLACETLKDAPKLQHA